MNQGSEATPPRRTEEANVFRVECAGASGWVVYLVGQPKPDHFLSRDLAVEHAKKRAREKRPSVVVVIETDGAVVAGWEFPLEGAAVA